MLTIIFTVVGVVVGALATYVYFSYTGSTLNFKKPAVAKAA
jgi:hypothetical protein